VVVPGWDQRLADRLIEAGVKAVATVPDAATAPVYAAIAPRTLAIRITREEEGVSVLAGAYLGGSLGALLMQNTGFGNCINALASYAIPSGIPMLLVINMRGDTGEFSPAQVPLGTATGPILESLGIPTFNLNDDQDVERYVPGAGKLSIAAKRPVALLLRKSLTGGKTG
jgi:sulfopyruvate decarboxylase alpha subunit